MVRHHVGLVFNILAYKISRFLNYPLTMPVNITLSITNKCYSRCKTCNIWKVYLKKPQQAHKELSTGEWEKILKNMGKTPIWFTLTGGETMLRKDIVDLVSFIIKYNDPNYINIATSGIYPKKTTEYLKKILELLSKTNIILTANISVDELNEKYDYIRGVPKGFEKVKQTLLALKKLKKKYPNFIIGTNIVLSKYNYKRFQIICNYVLKELQPDSLVSEIGSKRKAIYFNDDISVPVGKYIENLNYLLTTNTQTNSAKITSFFRKKYYNLVKKHLKINSEIIKCYAGYASCEISCTGDVWNCAVRADSMGSLRENNYDLKRIWKSNQAQKVRTLIKEQKCFCNTANPNYTNLLCNFNF